MLRQLVPLKSPGIQVDFYVVFRGTVDDEYVHLVPVFMMNGSTFDSLHIFVGVTLAGPVEGKLLRVEGRAVNSRQQRHAFTCQPVHLVVRVIRRVLPDVLAVEGNGKTQAAGHAGDLDTVRVAYERHKYRGQSQRLKHLIRFELPFPFHRVFRIYHGKLIFTRHKLVVILRHILPAPPAKQHFSLPPEVDAVLVEGYVHFLWRADL